MGSAPIRVAILGTGNIGTDLCERMLPDSRFEVVAFVGRRPDSPGLERMTGRVPYLLDSGLEGLSALWDEIDGVFDATSASSHQAHWSLISQRGKWAIDLTPSRIGKPTVPVLIEKSPAMVLSKSKTANYSMITCGGQSSAAVIHSISRHANDVEEIEVSSSIASLSAGPATRNNIDEYIETTENMATLLTGCTRTKSILVLNPAEPPVMMRTTVHVRAAHFDLDKILYEVNDMTSQVKKYVPGYDLVVAPHLVSDGQISATVRVAGAGFYLPSYSGNLDIINAAAVETAARHVAAHSS